MRGPSAPRPPGTMRVPREKSRRHDRSSSAWAAAKNGAPNPSATEPDTTASGRSSRLATDATARPTSVPVRSTSSGGACSGARPVMARIAVPDASASAQPCAAAAAPASGFDDHVTDVARVAVGTVEQPAVEHDAAADAGRHDHRDVVALTGGGAEPAFSEGQRLRVVVDPGRQTGVHAEPVAQRELAPRGDVDRRHEGAAVAHRSARTDTASVGARAQLGRERVEHRRQRREQNFGIARLGCRRPGAGDDPTVAVDDRRGQLGAADVDGDHGVHGSGNLSVACRDVRATTQIGESFVGDGVDAAHVNTVLGRYGGPVEAAWATALATPRPGHAAFVAVLRPICRCSRSRCS